MKQLVCLLEEPAAEAMLKVVCRSILPAEVQTRYIVFEGKQDMDKQLEKKLKHWNAPDSVFLVMRDQDSSDCLTIKQSLKHKVVAAGKIDKAVIRIACHELESFYLGDLEAVEQGIGLRGLSSMQGKSRFREPDSIANAAQVLKKLTKSKYQKISGSRAIASFLKLDGANRSHSFNVLLSGIKKLIEEQQ